MKLSRFSYSSVFGTALVVLFSVALCVSALAKGGKPGGGGGSGGGSTSGEFKPEILYVTSSGSAHNIVLANADGSNAQIVYASAGDIWQPDFSPTGNVIAFGERIGTGAPMELKTLSYTYDVAGITSVVVSGPIDTANFAFTCIDISPAGDELLYKKHDHSLPAYQLRVMPISGGTSTLVYEEGDYIVREAVWLYDGSGLALSMRLAEVVDQSLIARMDRLPDGTFTPPEMVFSSADLGPAVTSRGGDLSAGRTGNLALTSLGYVTYDKRGRLVGYLLLTVVDLDTGAYEILPTEGWEACFSSDDTKIVYRGASEQLEVSTFNAAMGEIGPGVAITTRNAGHPDWKPVAP